MSHIVFSSAAFWGDVMPYVPLANELARRGHEVVYSLPAGHHPVLEGEAFSLHDNGSRFTHYDVLGDAAQLRMLDAQKGSTTGTKMVRYWAKRYIAEDADVWAERTAEVLADADLMVTHPTAATLSAIPAEANGTPWVCGQLFPSMIPSAATDPAGMDLGRLPEGLARRLRRLLWRVAPAMASPIMQDGAVNRVRKRYGLAPMRGNMMLAWTHATHTAVLSSPLYTPPQPDWLQPIDVTGFTIWPGPSGSSVPDDVAAFLAAGEPPVLVTFGTSSATIAAPMLRDVAEALRRRGQRGLFLAGTAVTAAELDGLDGVFEFAPLALVLSQCVGVVHQGGHGTVAAALTAGLPAVAVPMGFDQVVHGRRLTELGVGAMVGHRGDRVAAIVEALDLILCPQVRAAARHLGERLAEEDGVSTAADLIERYC
ncbi:MAG TPA: glycosyltransferase [Acidimicrobiia bacterium]